MQHSTPYLESMKPAHIYMPICKVNSKHIIITTIYIYLQYPTFVCRFKLHEPH